MWWWVEFLVPYGPMLRSRDLPFLLGLLCCLLESCSVLVLEQVTVACKSSDHCYWCHVAGGGHCNSFEGCVGSGKPVLFWSTGNAFHDRIFVSDSFSISRSDFYHLVGCNRFLVHINLLPSQKRIEVRSSAPLQISRKCRDTALLKKRKNRYGNNLTVHTANMQIGCIWLESCSHKVVFLNSST